MEDVLTVATESKLYQALESVPELTGALAVNRPQGEASWLFITLQASQRLDEALERRICLALSEVVGTSNLPRIFQLSSLPRTHSGRVMKQALARFINQHELPNRAMMRNPEVLKEVASVTGLASQSESSAGQDAGS